MSARWPALDDHVATPETREELIAGEIRYVQPSEPARADRLSMLPAVMGSNIASGYVCAFRLLTRFAHDHDFGADVSIRKEGIDPATGARYLEELAFEIDYEQCLGDRAVRARVMAARGVRRIFVLVVSDDPAGNEFMVEWCAREERWVAMDMDGVLDDPSLVRPVRLRALLDGDKARDEVLYGVVAQGHPAIEERLQEPARRHLLALCRAWEIELTVERRAAIAVMDAETVKWLLDKVAGSGAGPRRRPEDMARGPSPRTC